MLAQQDFNFVTDYSACVELLKQAQETQGDDYYTLLQLYAETYQRVLVTCPRSLRSAERETLELDVLEQSGITYVTYLQALCFHSQYVLGLVHKALAELACEQL